MTNAPRITVGMTEAAVEELLGKPNVKKTGGEMLGTLFTSVSGDRSSTEAKTFAIYEHAAGTYQIVYSGGTVIHVNSQPS